ncbi:hypothetical protein CHS0354_017714 [Potamilus streckersoni]|uniref:Uncharacterized protein n=1 Tax=Potamilus streckersoni TaxID=2493646 RepID=A0AAE0S3H1_9BIVA|nr:hypothetical protein CHS0354_017714 [Potamilus streckersoni]
MEIDVDRSSISKLRIWRFVDEQPTWSDYNSNIIKAHRQQVAEHDRKVSPVYFRVPHPPYHRNQMRQRFILTNEPISENKWTPEIKIPSSTRKPTAKPASRMSTPVSSRRHPAPTSRLLQRRPLVNPVEPLSSDDNYFHALADEIDLRPIAFDRHAKSITFYSTHFPLILTQCFGKERAKSETKGLGTSFDARDEVVERKMYLNGRLEELNTMLDRLEEETEDVRFNTELRSTVFNPIEWQFVRIDPVSLYRRFTMEMIFENHLLALLEKEKKSKGLSESGKKTPVSFKIFE